MPVICELHPCQDATTEQLKELGKALEEWYHREMGAEGVLLWIDQEGLRSLLSGEPPIPLGLQVKRPSEGVNLEQIRQRLGGAVRDRSLRFAVNDEPDCTRDKVIESLRKAISAELVEDILIGDVSWNE